MKVTCKEEEILKILWETNEPMNLKQISGYRENMVGSTIQALLKKLLEKGLIEVHSINYSGTVLARSYTTTLSQELFIIERYDNLSISNLAEYLLENSTVPGVKEELKKIQLLLEEKL